MKTIKQFEACEGQLWSETNIPFIPVFITKVNEHDIEYYWIDRPDQPEFDYKDSFYCKFRKLQ